VRPKKKTLSVGKETVLAQLTDGLPRMTGIVCQQHTDKGPFGGLLALSARESTQRHGDQSSPHLAPTRSNINITIVVKAEANRDLLAWSGQMSRLALTDSAHSPPIDQPAHD